MKAPNPVQAVSHQRQQFHLGGMPQSAARPSAMIGGGPPQALGQQVHDLAIEIYARLIAGRFLQANYTSALDREHMGELAKVAQTSALAYFEQMGVKFQGGQNNG